ncbi:15461_t:CDS:1 [Funneliformis geosporum]|uniref:15461_t:CDS:1 n=1 Tax=Funneliformis geosporum TaxID=1117311 RepID=A0A9W4SB75_9GLOM|nr:15461_t:CDS:1 [Funneliformis geosporum]
MTSNNDKRMESLSQVIPEELAKKMEKALLEVLETAICQNFKESSKFVRDHFTYVKKLRLAENPYGYARYITRKLVPDEISYNTRLEKIQVWYREKLHTKLEELYSLYYEISQEEKCEISKDNAKGIIQGLLNMSLTDD